MNTCLLLVDLQNDYFPGGNMELVGIEDACATKDLIFKGRTIKAADVHASFMAALSVPYARVLSTKEIIASRG